MNHIYDCVSNTFAGHPLQLVSYSSKIIFVHTTYHPIQCFGFFVAELFKLKKKARWERIAEWHHNPVQLILNQLFFDQPVASKSLIIDYSDLSVPHTIELERFTLTVFFLSTKPRLPVRNYYKQSQSLVIRMDQMTSARR